MYLVLLVIVQHQTFQGILLVLLFGFQYFNHLMLCNNPCAHDSNICCNESLKPHISYVVCIIHGNGLMCISNSSISWSVITVMIFAILFLIVGSLLNHHICNPHFLIYGKFLIWKCCGHIVVMKHMWMWNCNAKQFVWRTLKSLEFPVTKKKRKKSVILVGHRQTWLIMTVVELLFFHNYF